MGLCGSAIIELYKKRDLDLHADLTKVPDNNSKNSVHFLSNCTMAGLLLGPPPSHHELHSSEKYMAAQRLQMR